MRKYDVFVSIPSPLEMPNDELARLFIKNEGGKISFKYQIAPIIMQKYRYSVMCEAVLQEMQDYVTATLHGLRTQGYEFITVPQFKVGECGEVIVYDWIYEYVR